MADKKKITRVSHDAVLGEMMGDRVFREEYERRRLVQELAMAVRSMRESAGLTQEQLATRIGVTQPVIGRLERALEQRRPRFDLLQRIAFALGKQLKFVFTTATTEEPLVEVQAPRRERSAKGAESRIEGL